MIERRIEEKLSQDFFEPRTVLLCSEHTAEHCHRRLVVEYLGLHWEGISAVHLPRDMPGSCWQWLASSNSQVTKVDILCLANAWKKSPGRCVAGINMGDGSWVPSSF